MENTIRLTIAEFKEEFSVKELTIVRNPKTQKLFVSSSKGNFKCQSNLDLGKPMCFIGEDKENLCLINDNAVNVLGTL